jgi:hypothetical protein
MAKESTSAYIMAIVGIVLIVGIVTVVTNLNFGSVSVETATEDTTGQAYTVVDTSYCDTVDCGNEEVAICYADEEGNCNCPVCSTSGEEDLNCNCPVCSTSGEEDLTGQVAKMSAARMKTMHSSCDYPCGDQCCTETQGCVTNSRGSTCI